MENPIIQTDLADILKKLDLRFGKLEDSLESRFEKIEVRFEKLEGELENKFEKLENRLEKMDDRLGRLEVGQAEIKVKVNTLGQTTSELKSTCTTYKSDVSDLKGAKSLIIPIVVAVTTSLVTLLLRAIPIS